uniref:Uncharacterized protein n=1 Tax=Sinocyclocheilus rhinocerous TaxID=307959 RepID=A0A673GPL7_9TELE
MVYNISIYLSHTHTHTHTQVFSHADFSSPLFSESYREVHSIFRQTLQGTSLQQLNKTMLGNLQVVLERGLPYEHDWLEEGLQSFTNRIMFEAGFLTLFGKDAGFVHADGMSDTRIWMQKAVQDFLVFDRAFPVLAAGVPIGLCAQAWQARDALAEELLHDKLHRRKCISDLIQRRMDAFDHMHLDETGKARTHVFALLSAISCRKQLFAISSCCLTDSHLKHAHKPHLAQRIFRSAAHVQSARTHTERHISDGARTPC